MACLAEAEPRLDPQDESPNEELCLAWPTAWAVHSSSVLHHGSMAQVWRVKTALGTHSAVKVVDRPCAGQDMDEVCALRRCTEALCRYVVRLQDVVECEPLLLLRMELCTGGSLLDYARRRPGGHLDEGEATIWSVQLLTGLMDLHAISIIHQDIRPANLLLSQEGALRIADFGCAADASLGSSKRGALSYMAPELMRGSAPCTAVDVWSVGVTLLELLTCRTVHPQLADHGTSVPAEVVDDLIRSCPPPEEARPRHVSSMCWEFLRAMLVPDARERVSVTGARSHMWVQVSPASSVASTWSSGDCRASHVPVPAKPWSSGDCRASHVPVPPKLPPPLETHFRFDTVGTDLLGEGTFAKIWKILGTASDDAFALKVLDRDFYASHGLSQQVDCEIHILRRVAGCRNIVRLHDVFAQESLVFLRLDLCRCSLFDHALALPGRLVGEEEVSVWAEQLFSGLQDLHHLRILHRDIKPENLLLTPDGELRISDFGWAADLEMNVGDVAAFAGTLHYMAPEILQGARQTAAVDVWSSGATLWELLLGAPLVPDLPGRSRQSFLCEVRRVGPAVSAKPSGLTPSCWQLLGDLLELDALRRACLADALAHPWVSKTWNDDGHPSSDEETHSSSSMPSDRRKSDSSRVSNVSHVSDVSTASSIACEFVDCLKAVPHGLSEGTTAADQGAPSRIAGTSLVTSGTEAGNKVVELPPLFPCLPTVHARVRGRRLMASDGTFSLAATQEHVV